MVEEERTQNIEDGKINAKNANLRTQPTETTKLLNPTVEQCEGAVEGQILEREKSVLSVNQLYFYLIVPFFVYCLAVGAVAAPKINIVVSLMCRKYHHDLDSPRLSWELCDDTNVHAAVARFMVCANLTSGTLGAFSSPRLGKWSDHYGRRAFIAISAVGMLSGDVISVVAAWFPNSIPVHFILLEYVIGGLTGAFLTTMSLTQSYAADCTRPEERTRVFSMLHACVYLGSAIGPAAGALLVRSLGHANTLTVFYAAGVCHLMFIGFVLICLPEHRSARNHRLEDRSVSQSSRPAISYLRSVLNALNVLKPLSIFRTSGNGLPLIALTDAIISGVQVGLPAIYILYSESHFHWTHFETNVFLSATNSVRAIILMVILPLLLKFWTRGKYRPDQNHTERSHVVKIRGNNILIARMVMIAVVLGELGAGSSKDSKLFAMSSIATSVGAVIPPLMQSTMTTYVDSQQVGELFGAISLAHAVGRAVIPALMQLIYSLTVQNRDGSVFYVLSALFAIFFMYWSMTST